MSSTINDRALLLIEDLANPSAGGRRSWERLSELTSISVDRWRNVSKGRQKVTLDMLEALVELRPQSAFWLISGATDTANGHVAPPNAVTFPEREQTDDLWATAYFKQSMMLLKQLYSEGNVDLTDDAARLAASTREKVLVRYNFGPLANTAYSLADSEDYRQAVVLWNNRERDRSQHLSRIMYIPERETESSGQVGKETQGDPLIGSNVEGMHQSPWEMFYRR